MYEGFREFYSEKWGIIVDRLRNKFPMLIFDIGFAKPRLFDFSGVGRGVGNFWKCNC